MILSEGRGVKESDQKPCKVDLQQHNKKQDKKLDKSTFIICRKAVSMLTFGSVCQQTKKCLENHNNFCMSKLNAIAFTSLQ